MVDCTQVPILSDGLDGGKGEVRAWLEQRMLMRGVNLQYSPWVCRAKTGWSKYPNSALRAPCTWILPHGSPVYNDLFDNQVKTNASFPCTA